MKQRLGEVVLIEASTLATPLVLERDSATAGVIWLAQEVAKYLPGATVIVLFPRDDTISPWARETRNRLDFAGARTSTRGAARDAVPARTRQLFHIRSEGLSRPAGHFEFALDADRIREFVVPLGELPQWEVVCAAILEYAATMAFPVGVYASDEDHQDFDSFGVAEDEEPF